MPTVCRGLRQRPSRVTVSSAVLSAQTALYWANPWRLKQAQHESRSGIYHRQNAAHRAQAANVTVLHVGRASLESPDPCGSERPVAKLAVRGRYLDGVDAYPFSGSATNLYPTPRTVSKWRGFAGSSSI